MNDFSVAFYIGPIPVPWYGLIVTLALIVSSFFAYIEWKKKNLNKTIFIWLFFSVIISGFFGARWFYLLFHPQDIVNWASFFSLTGGRSIIGGVIFSGIITSIIIKIGNIDIDRRELFTIILPNLLLAQSIGRWGNFTSQELYGVQAESLNHLPDFIKNGMYIEVDGVSSYYKPLFLYESFLNFIGWIFIVFILKNIDYFKLGTQGSFYFIWYGITRASMELFRDPEFIMNINGFPTSFFWSLIFILFGIVTFIIFQFYWDEWSYFWEEEWNVYRRYFLDFFVSLKFLFSFNFQKFKINNKEIKLVLWNNLNIKKTKKYSYKLREIF